LLLEFRSKFEGIVDKEAFNKFGGVKSTYLSDYDAAGVAGQRYKLKAYVDKIAV